MLEIYGQKCLQLFFSCEESHLTSIRISNAIANYSIPHRYSPLPQAVQAQENAIDLPTPPPFLSPSTQETHDVLYFLNLMSAFLDDDGHEEQVKGFFPLLQQELKSKIIEIRERSLEFHTRHRTHKKEQEEDERRLALVSVADHYAAAKKELEDGISNLAEEQALFAEVAAFGKHIEAIMDRDGNIVSSIFLNMHQKSIERVREQYLRLTGNKVSDKGSTEDVTSMLPHLRKAPNMLNYMGALQLDRSTPENLPWNFRSLEVRGGPALSEERKKGKWLQFTDNARCPPFFELGLPDDAPAEGVNPQFDFYSKQVLAHVGDFQPPTKKTMWEAFKSDARKSICANKVYPQQPDMTQLVAVGGTVSVRALSQLRMGMETQKTKQRADDLADAAQAGADPPADDGDDGSALLGWLGSHQASSAMMLSKNLREEVKFDRIAEGGLATIREAVGRRLVQPALVLAHSGEKWRAQRVFSELFSVIDKLAPTDQVWPPASVSRLFVDVLGSNQDLQKTKLVAGGQGGNNHHQIEFRYKHNDYEFTGFEWTPVSVEQTTLKQRALHTGSLVVALTPQLLFHLSVAMKSKGLPLVWHNLQFVERRTSTWSSRSTDPNANVFREVEEVIRDVSFIPTAHSRKDLFLGNNVDLELEDFSKDSSAVRVKSVTIQNKPSPVWVARKAVSELSDLMNFPTEADLMDEKVLPVTSPDVEDEVVDEAGRKTFLNSAPNKARDTAALLRSQVYVLGGTVEIRASDFAQLNSVNVDVSVLSTDGSNKRTRAQKKLTDAIKEGFLLGDLDIVKRPVVRGYDESKAHAMLRDGRVLTSSMLRPSGSETEAVTSVYFNDRYFRQDRAPDTTAKGTRGMIRLKCLAKDEMRVIGASHTGELPPSAVSCVGADSAEDDKNAPEWVTRALSGDLPDANLPVPSFSTQPSAGLEQMWSATMSRSGKIEVGRHFFLAKFGLMSGEPALVPNAAVGRRMYKLNDHALIDGVRFSKCADEGKICQCPGRGASRVAFIRPLPVPANESPDEDVVGNIRPTPIRGMFDTDTTPMKQMPGEMKCEATEFLDGGSRIPNTRMDSFSPAFSWQSTGKPECPDRAVIQHRQFVSVEQVKQACLEEPECLQWSFSNDPNDAQGQGWLCREQKWNSTKNAENAKQFQHWTFGVKLQFRKRAGARGVCAAANLLEHRLFQQEDDVRKACLDTHGCNSYIFSEDADNQSGGGWLCKGFDAFDTADQQHWPKWKVGKVEFYSVQSSDKRARADKDSGSKGQCFCDTSAADVILPIKPELQLKASAFLESAGGPHSAFGPFDGRVTKQGKQDLLKYLSSRGAGAATTSGHVAQTMRYSPGNASFHPNELVVVLRRNNQNRDMVKIGTIGSNGCRFKSTDASAIQDAGMGVVADTDPAGPWKGLPGDFGPADDKKAAGKLGDKRGAVTVVEVCEVEIDGEMLPDEIPAWDLASPKMNSRVYYAPPNGAAHRLARIIGIDADVVDNPVIVEYETDGKRYRVPLKDLRPLIDSAALLQVFDAMSQRVLDPADMVQAARDQQKQRQAAAEAQARQRKARERAAAMIDGGATALPTPPEVYQIYMNDLPHQTSQK